jgi:hypothetical protein
MRRSEDFEDFMIRSLVWLRNQVPTPKDSQPTRWKPTQFLGVLLHANMNLRQEATRDIPFGEIVIERVRSCIVLKHGLQRKKSLDPLAQVVPWLTPDHAFVT